MIRAIAFDFDGVLVESTNVKTSAMARLFSGEGSQAVERILKYHVSNAGISRFVKFEVIYRDILKRPLPETEFQRLCREFSRLVVGEVIACPAVPGAVEFLQAHWRKYRFFIVSGTPEKELREIVRRRGISAFFDEVRGSPATKETLLADVMARRQLSAAEVIFIGDAETDWRAAQAAGVGFILRRSPGAPALLDFSGPTIGSLLELDPQLPPRSGFGCPASNRAGVTL